jgi:hypothetical protein
MRKIKRIKREDMQTKQCPTPEQTPDKLERIKERNVVSTIQGWVWDMKWGRRKEELETLNDDELLAYNAVCRMTVRAITSSMEEFELDRQITLSLIRERGLSPRYPEKGGLE